MMFSSNHKKILLMLSVFLCLACVIGCVSAADVDDAVIVDSDSNSIAIDSDAGADIPYIPIPVNDTETIIIDADGNVINNYSSIDYKHLPVGTTIKIVMRPGLYHWEIGDCTGVELIEHCTVYERYAPPFTFFVFKVTSENYNIELNKYNPTGIFIAIYNFMKNPFGYGANVTVKEPVNTCLACSNVQDELIGSDVIQMDSLSVVDDAVIVDSDSNSIAIDSDADVDDAVIVDSDSNSIAIDSDAGADIPIIIPIPLNDNDTIATGFNDPNIDYKHLPVGTTITIHMLYHNRVLSNSWKIGDCTGVELIENCTNLLAQYFTFKVTSENYNIILNKGNWDITFGFSAITYNFTDNPFGEGALLTVKKPSIITIYIPYGATGWHDDGSKGVKLISSIKTGSFFKPVQKLTYEICSEDFNIKLIQYNIFWFADYYNYNKNHYRTEHNDKVKVTVKAPVNTCLACSNIQDELIGSDVILMNSLSVVDDAVKQPVNTCLSCFNVPTTSIGVPVPQFPYEIILHGIKTVEIVPALYSFAIIKIVDFFKHIF